MNLSYPVRDWQVSRKFEGGKPALRWAAGWATARERAVHLPREVLEVVALELRVLEGTVHAKSRGYLLRTAH